MRKTQSLNSGKQLLQERKRSKRSKSKPKIISLIKAYNENITNSEVKIQRSNSITKLMEFDPNFKEFNVTKYEAEVNSYREARITDLQGIVSGSYNSLSQIDQTNHDDSQTKIIKFLNAPEEQFAHEEKYGENETRVANDTALEMSCQETLKSRLMASKIKKTPSKVLKELEKCLHQNKRFESTLTLEPITISKALNTEFDDEESEEEDSIDVGESEIADLENLNVDEAQDLFTMAYRDRIQLLENSDLNEIQKSVHLNKLYKCWIVDLYKQNHSFLDVIQDLNSTKLSEKQKFEDDISYLKKQINDLHSEKSQWKAKADALLYENNRNNSTVHKLQADMNGLAEQFVEKEVENQTLSNDVKSLTRLLLRLRDDGIWDLTRLSISPSLYCDIFEGYEYLLGRPCFANRNNEKVETNVGDNAKNFELQNEENLLKLERYRAKIFIKEKHLQKLKYEEQCALARLRETQFEEERLKSRIKELVGKRKGKGETGKGSGDEDLDKFWNF